VLGLLDSEPLGLAMLGLAPLILLTEIREMRIVESDLLPAVILVALATLSYEITILVTLAVKGEQLDWLASVLDVLVPAAIANVLLLLPVYGILRLASLDLRQRRAI
jgi:cell shape-determining protein MreD